MIEQFKEESEWLEVPEVQSGDGIIRTFEQCTEWAEKVGCHLRVAKPDELFVDIDTEDQYQTFARMAHWYNENHIIYNKWVITPSKSGLLHRHIVVKLRNPNAYSLVERVAMQATLGSDPMREAISLKRARDGEDNVVIFFEPK